MSFISKILTSLLLVIVLFFITLTVFLWGTASFEEISDEFLGITEYSENSQAFTWGLLYKYSSQEDFVLALNSKNPTVLENDEYLLDASLIGEESFFSSFKRIWKEYMFSGDGYRITQLGVGEVFIDTKANLNSHFVYNVSSSVQVDFFHNETGDPYTSIFLLPGMYLEFQPARGKLLDNSDRLRVETIYKLGYIGWDVLSSLSDPVVQKYLSQDLVDLFRENNLKQKKIATKDLDFLLQLDSTAVDIIAHLDFFEPIFLNDEKKVFYYKNLLFHDILALLHGERINKASFTRNYAKLQELSLDATFDIQKLISKIQVLSYYTWDTTPGLELEFSELLGTHLEESEKEEFSLMVHKYHFISPQTYNFLRDFEAYYTLSLVSEFDEYFMFYFEEVLLRELNKDASDFPIIIEALLYTQKMGDRVYSKNDKFTQTGLLKYNEILELLHTFVGENFFESNRDENNLLVKKNEELYSNTQIQIFESNIKNILEYIRLHSDVLRVNDLNQSQILKDLPVHTEKYTEYIMALKNPEEYKKQYSTTTQNIIGLLNAQWGNDSVVDVASIRTYLLRFRGRDSDDFIVEAWEDDSISSFKIENYMMYGVAMSFTLIPSQDMLLTDISMDNVERNFQYKLRVIEQNYEETLKNNVEDPEYFEDFLIKTFFTQQQTNAEYFEYEVQANTEDKLDIVFKRDILLWDDGEFSDLKDIFTFSYDTISIQKNEDLYDVFLANVPFVYIYQDGDDSSANNMKSIQWRMSGEYVMRTGEESYFQNIQINVFLRDKENTRIVFDNKWISVLGEVYKDDFSEILFALNSYIEPYNQVSSAVISNNGGVEGIEFDPVSRKMSIKFVKDRKTCTIVFNTSFVLAILDEEGTVLKRGVRFSELSETL